MKRVWLTEWEWACCGDPFGLGDELDFGIESRTVYPALADILGPEVLATVDAMESHQEEFPDRVRGRVAAVYTVTREVIERRSLRRPGHGAPPDATMPTNGGDWPMVGRTSGEGAFWGTRPSRYMIEIVPVPGTAKLTPVQSVRQPVTDQAQQLQSAADLAADPLPEQRRRTISGWLVDIQEQAQEVR
ncbi:DUF6578 domain-containing protein (plasmid) [Coraliomargarita sp. W4R53]